ncbi:pyruvate oxidase [Desulfonispora thiosulfatigenes DSM 11270]|uniref:Pyruvate oxidase n=1 Tax=Desulfonispora thiosulfatigenes DSM 11270 TaxID=656914 RepID=A0A1W1VGB9_DESTI|nr:thiamine pyrophosphate-binding protein [Desulfonispora thiosulfatigenes]SMB92427.1 pyruvate oxidase [Desulfonispora thiosulfatigenes DSM 11270]
MGKKDVSNIILDQLVEYGVKRIFGFAGDANLTFIDAINKHPQIEYIATRHEGAAAFMASAEAKLTGRVGVCTATCGPGTANLLNGLADAYSDKAPVLAITGQVPTKYIGTNYKQYIDEQVLMAPIAKYSSLLVSEEATIDILYKALQISIGQGSVTHLAVPKDIFTKPCSNKPKKKENIYKAQKTPQKMALDKAINLINIAQRPMLLLGRGAKEYKKKALKLSDNLGAAITYSLGATGIISSENKYFVGGLGLAGTEGSSDLLHQADLVVIIGSTWWPEQYVPENTVIIQIDGVLENLGLSANINIGIEGCIGEILDEFIEKINVKKNEKWQEVIKETKNKWLQELEEEINKEQNLISPLKLVAEIEKEITSDSIISLDVGDHTLWFNKVFKKECEQVLISGTWRSMGFGLPAGLAAKFEYPSRQVIVLAGDGGLTMSMSELVTAAEKNIAVKIIVFNNKALAMEKNRMIKSKLESKVTNLYNPDFSELAKACGIEGYKVKELSELNVNLKKALASNKPALIDVDISMPMPAHTKL